MAGAQPTSGKTGRARNYIESLRGDLQDLQGPRALIAELIQNADDAVGATCMRFEISADALTVWNDAEFSQCDDIYSGVCSRAERDAGRCDFHSFREVSGAAKRERLETTGAFGIGFTAVYQITDRPVLLSAGWRWEIDEMQPDHERIDWAAAPGLAGTTFRFPWARTASRMRSELGQDPVTDELIGELSSELLASAPESLLFLRRLDRIEVVPNGAMVSFDRSSDGALTTISGSDGSIRRWYVVSESISDVAQRLMADGDHVIPPQRSTKVDVAIGLDDPAATGKYFATLPTEETTGLAVSVNGSFFPKRDRKSILVDSSRRGDWNRAIIECAAKTVASNLEAVTELAGDRWITQLLAAADSAAKSAHVSTGWDPARLWRPHLWAALPNSKVVPTCSSERRTIGTALVWSDQAEHAAASTLEKLGVYLVHPDVRAEWFGLRSIGVEIQPLHLKHVTHAISTRHRGAPFADGGLDDDDRAPLWSLIDYLLALAGQRSNEESRTELDRIALHPLRTGGHGAANDSYTAMPGTVGVIDRAGLTPRLVDLTFERAYPNLAGRVPEVGVSQMLTWFSRAFGNGEVRPDFDRSELLDWFANRSEAALQVEHQLLTDLPIYPTGSGHRALGDDVVLPASGFDEPLRLASVINLHGRPATVASFLEQLGVPRLDLRHYCANLLRQDVVDDLEDQQVVSLLAFLRRNHSLIEQDDEVKRNLRSLRLIPCTDGVRRQGRDVYLGSVDARVVGTGPPRVTPDLDTRDWALLLTWLGVADKPRPTDVVAHCGALRQPPSNHTDIVAAVLTHLSDVEPDRLEASYSRLKQERWLPIRGKPGHAARPVDVYTNFRRNIFASQASFLDLPQSIEQSGRQVLQWLGVQTNPTPEMVVKHLLRCAEDRVPVKDDLWQFLSDNIEAKELDRLSSRRCILLGDGGYVEPSHCFWESNPFGTYRYRLDESFSRWRLLHTRLGARVKPSAQDAVDVLGEVAFKHGGAEAPVLSNDRDVVLRAWVFLNDQLDRGEATAGDLAELATVECVIDGRDRLRRPGDVLFRDSSLIAKHLDDEAASRLIERPENIAGALEAAGVRRLRDAISIEIVERRDRSEPSRFSALVADRRHLLARALRSVTADPASALERFETEVAVSPLTELVVIERVELAGTTLRTEAITRPALWLRDDHSFLLIEPVDRWPEVAKEFAIALDATDGDDPEVIAMLVKAVLAARTTVDAANELDGLGFAEIDQAVAVSDVEHAATAYTDDHPDQEDDDELTSVAPESRPSAQEPPAVPGAEPAPATSTQTGRGQPDQAELESRAGHRPPPATGPTPGVGEKAAGVSVPRRDARRRSRLKSYVTPAAGTSDEPDSSDEAERRDEIEAQAIAAVIDYEVRAGRIPHEMPPGNPGYDIESTDQDGGNRVIEVKGTAGQWDGMGVGLTSREFEEARLRGPDYWLYVVEVREGRRREIHRIQDPAEQVDRFFFDDGWRAVTVPSELTADPLPAVPNQLAADDGTTAVKLLDWLTGLPTESWVRVPPAAGQNGSLDQLFAIQLAGNALGIGTRGGVAFAVATTVAEDEDLVVVRLVDRIDPDTGSSICVRFWSPEASLDPTKSPVRLQSDGAVAPISLEDRSLVEVLGRVVHIAAPASG